MHKLHLYNTLGRRLEQFIPIDDSLVRIYSCGPTVYSTPHIGNIRSFVFASLLKNVLGGVMGYDVKHVMNITDVGHLVSDEDSGEDKMEKGARREGVTAWEVAQRYTDEFLHILEQLDINFDHTPKATDHIQEQIDMIIQLEKGDYTYTIPGDGIYFDTSKMKDYGVLVGKKHLEGIQSGSRVEDSGKKTPTDFALWKFNITGKKRDMERDSPRGVGFPGRHIECSAMSIKYLGTQFDIHTGGIDHIPIHHTNEIAQSECSVSPRPRVKYRVHHQFLNSEGNKISKSLDNGYTLDQILERGYTPYDLKYFYFQAHYRSFQDFTRESLEAAKKGRKGLKLVEDKNYPLDQVVAPLLNDLNTPVFIANLHKHGISKKLNHIFKLVGEDEDNLEKLDIPEEIMMLAQSRRGAKIEKNWALADDLRSQIEKKGYKILDGDIGFTVEKL